MRSINTLLLTLSLSFFNNITYAESGGIVQALQMPVWLQRGDVKTALKPGMEINTGDMIITGSRARVLINLEEGSQVKIGANSKIDFSVLEPAEEQGGFYEGFIRVVSGAFRFATTALGRSRLRNLSINIGVITAGIRGTDIWGSSVAGEDNLVLIEGSITAQRKGEPDFEMSDVLSWYNVPNDKPAQAIITIPQDKLARWAAQTELLSGAGVVSIDGAWAVNLMSLKNRDSLINIRIAMARKGYANSMQQVEVRGKTWYRLSVKGFQSKADASIFAQSIEGEFGIRRPWVARF